MRCYIIVVKGESEFVSPGKIENFKGVIKWFGVEYMELKSNVIPSFVKTV